MGYNAREFLLSAMHARALCFVLIWCRLFTQSAAPGSVASIEGTVLNKLTGAPVKNAHVMYIRVPSSAGDASQTIGSDTGSDGRFVIQVEPGSYRLWVERPGFAHQTYGAHSPRGTGSVLTVSPSQQLRDLEIKLTPLGAIAGSVFDEDGDPLQGVGIQVLRFSYSTGRRQLIPVSGGSSNDRGEYRVYGLPAGRYLLLATPRGSPLSKPMETSALIPQTQEPFAPLYYPGVLDSDSASEVLLPEGAEIAGMDFRLPKIRAVTVRGRLLSPLEDLAASELQIVLAHSEGDTASYISRNSGAIDKASGRFEFRGVAPGSYWLVATELLRGRALSGRMPLEVSASAPPENLALALMPAFAIQGRVEADQGAAGLAKVNVRLVSADSLAPGPPPASQVASDGSVRLAGLTPGVWDLVLDPLPDGFWIKSATFGDQDVLQGQLNVLPGAQGMLHVMLASGGAQISGTVNGNGSGAAAAATVVLVPADTGQRRSAAMYRTVATQEQGRFVFKGVRPGTYKLFAFEDVEPFAWLDAEAMKPVESLGEIISVAEGERAARQLVAIPAEALVPSR